MFDSFRSSVATARESNQLFFAAPIPVTTGLRFAHNVNINALSGHFILISIDPSLS
jgi:hypothetical protein